MVLPSSLDLSLIGSDCQQTTLQKLWFTLHVLMTIAFLIVLTLLHKQLISSASFSAQEYCAVDAKIDSVQFWGVQSVGSAPICI